MNDRFGTPRATGLHPFVLAVLTGLLVLGLTSNALAQGRGPLVILGLRAPDGDDEAASNATTALRRAARNAGFEVPNDSPALEQSMASFGCDDSLPPTCLMQIANDLHAQRMVYGQVRRHGRGREATLTIDVSMFETASQNTTGHDQVEVPRAMAQDNDSLNASATRLMGTIAPAPNAVVAVVGPSSPSPPVVPSHPAPVRRYVSYGLIGVGGALVVTGVVFGVMWGMLNSSTNGNNDAVWISYHPEITDYAVICRTARMDATAGGAPQNALHARDVCNSGDSDAMLGWTLGSIGAALLATGTILLVTDHSSDADHAARNTRPHFAIAPNVSPAYQGATVFVSF